MRSHAFILKWPPILLDSPGTKPILTNIKPCAVRGVLPPYLTGWMRAATLDAPPDA